MGVRFKQHSDSAATISPALREALLFTTMSIIGLTVEVHIKDGSVYSGIFHTASFDRGYGVFLKKARMIKKGIHASSGVNRCLIDTLLVPPDNLVQVIAKSVMISPDGVCNVVGCDNVGAVKNDIKSSRSTEKVAGSANSQLDARTDISVRQNGVHKPQEEGTSNAKPVSTYQKEEPVHEVQASSISCKLEDSKLQVTSRKENDKAVIKQLPNGTPGKIASQNTRDGLCQPQADSSAVKTVPSTTSDKARSSSFITPAVPIQNSVANKKESKLNPGAKIFSPSLANVRSVAAPPMLQQGGANVAHVPSYFPAMPLNPPQSEIGIRSFPPSSSLPLKLVSYGNMATSNGSGNGLQYTQPIAATIPNRQHPIRYSGQYQSIQPGPVYVQPVNQNGLMGRTGQLVYLNPATHEFVPGPLPYTHIPHPQLTSHTVHFPKHEVAGVITAPPPHLSFNPPLMANEQLQFAVTSPFPLAQPPFQSIRPVPILGPSHNPYGTTAKYL